MPHALTERQKEYLQFLRRYIRENEMTPRLEEIANHFGVKLPTAHKTLDALQIKGYLMFRRGSESGYYIRMAERGGSIEKMIELFIIGKIDRFGEIINFSEELGHFPIVLMGVDEYHVFALEVIQDISQANILSGDYLICDYGKRPQPGDICIAPFGERFFLISIRSKTLDRDTPHFEVSIDYPIPDDLIKDGVEQKLHWAPLAWDESTHDYFMGIVEEQNVPLGPIPPEYILGTALRLSRALAF